MTFQQISILFFLRERLHRIVFIDAEILLNYVKMKYVLWGFLRFDHNASIFCVTARRWQYIARAYSLWVSHLFKLSKRTSFNILRSQILFLVHKWLVSVSSIIIFKKKITNLKTVFSLYCFNLTFDDFKFNLYFFLLEKPDPAVL